MNRGPSTAALRLLAAAQAIADTGVIPALRVSADLVGMRYSTAYKCRRELRELDLWPWPNALHGRSAKLHDKPRSKAYYKARQVSTLEEWRRIAGPILHPADWRPS